METVSLYFLAMPMRILLLGADISDNSLGRIWILADMLAPYAAVRIAGLSTRGGVWPPLADNTAHAVEVVPKGHFLNLCGSLHLLRYVWRSDADIIYVCKPKFPTMVAALLGARGRKLALDNDDWEAGCARGGFSSKAWVNWLATRGISFTQAAEWLIPFFRRRTVSNAFLQQRYGGVVMPHARDAMAFSAPVDRAAFGLPEGKKLVMFFGTPHRHKGVEELITAMGMTKEKDLVLVVAGLTAEMAEYADYHGMAERLLRGRYVFLPFVPWAKAPALLACADILVVPQKDTLFTRWGQTPAKIFDAMAAGKPLIVSDIADTRALVGEDAWLVAPDSAEGIAVALETISQDWEQAKRKAARLKARFTERYSYAVVGPTLKAAVLEG